MRNLTNPSKAGGHYELDGITVLKREGLVTVEESTPLYAEPRQDADRMHYHYEYCLDFPERGAVAGKVPSVFLAGFVTRFDAHSLKWYEYEGTGRGIWYHVYLNSSLLEESTEGEPLEWGWIFTGSAVELGAHEPTDVYDALLEETATASGAVVWNERAKFP